RNSETQRHTAILEMDRKLMPTKWISVDRRGLMTRRASPGGISGRQPVAERRTRGFAGGPASGHLGKARLRLSTQSPRRLVNIVPSRKPIMTQQIFAPPDAGRRVRR